MSLFLLKGIGISKVQKYYKPRRAQATPLPLVPSSKALTTSLRRIDRANSSTYLYSGLLPLRERRKAFEGIWTRDSSARNCTCRRAGVVRGSGSPSAKRKSLRPLESPMLPCARTRKPVSSRWATNVWARPESVVGASGVTATVSSRPGVDSRSSHRASKAAGSMVRSGLSRRGPAVDRGAGVGTCGC